MLRLKLSLEKGSEDQWTVTQWRLRCATTTLKKYVRREWKLRNQALDRDIAEAWRSRRFADLDKFTRWRAGTGVGPKQRHYCQVVTSRPSLEEWQRYLSKDGKEGGLRAEAVDFDGECNKMLAESEALTQLSEKHVQLAR